MLSFGGNDAGEGDVMYSFYIPKRRKWERGWVSASAEALSRTGELMVKVEVSNTGTRAGDEVVQLYVEYPNSKVPRPVKQLVGFERVHLKVGESEVVELVLKAGNLGYWNVAKQAVVVESGAVVISVQSSAADVKLRKEVGMK